MEELKKIEASLIKLQEEFNIQISAMTNDSKIFHNSIIELSAKYPNHKELLQFIVQINDKLETNQSIFSDIVIDSFNDMINVKHVMLKKMILTQEKMAKENLKNSPFIDKIKKIEFSKNMKFITISTIIMLSLGFLTIGIIVAPEHTILIIESIKSLIPGVK